MNFHLDERGTVIWQFFYFTHFFSELNFLILNYISSSPNLAHLFPFLEKEMMDKQALPVTHIWTGETKQMSFQEIVRDFFCLF